MAKPWTEVEKSEGYLQLSPADKIKAKQEYWDTVVSPKKEFQGLSPTDKILAKKEFGLTTLPSFAGLPKIEETEQRIQERRSPYEILAEEGRKKPELFKHPLSTMIQPAVFGLKTAQIPWRIGESALASTGLALQRGKPQDIAKDVWQSLQGKRMSEFGDIIRTTGFGGVLNEPIAKSVGFLTSMKLGDIVSKGKVILGAKKGETFLKSRIPQVMDKDYVLNRAKLANEGIETLHKGLKDNYDEIFNKIGNKEVNIIKAQDIVDNLPQNIITKIKRSNRIEYTPQGLIKPTIKNLKEIRNTLNQSVPDKVWTSRVYADPTQGIIKDAYYKIGKLMAEGNDDLIKLNERYHQFRTMAEELNDILLDKYGVVREKGLISLFKKGAERNKQIFFEKFAQQYPQAEQIAKDIVKYNQRQGLKKFGKKALGYGVGGYGAYRLGEKLFENIGFGGNSGSYAE